VLVADFARYSCVFVSPVGRGTMSAVPVAGAPAGVPAGAGVGAGVPAGAGQQQQRQQQGIPANVVYVGQQSKRLLDGASSVSRDTMKFTMLATVALGVIWWLYGTEAAITNSMVDTFAVGVDGWVPSDETATVARAALMDDLLPILQPDHSKQYFVILGEKGVGKSTAVRQTIKQLEDPRGVIYMMAPNAAASFFVSQLAQTVNYRKALNLFGRAWTLVTGDSDSGEEDASDSRWGRLQRKLLEVGKAYLTKHNRPPVLVIDAADKIYKEDPKLLFHIQALAKDGADSGCLRVVFVISETSAFEMLQSHSHASRSKMFLVGEIKDDEAVDYLVSKGINKENATDAVARITGGRFALLNSYASAHQDGMTNDQVLVNYKRATKITLKHISVNVTDDVFRAVSTGSLFEDDDSVSVEQLAQLTRENILTVNPCTRLVAFNSRYVQTFFIETGLCSSLCSRA